MSESETPLLDELEQGPWPSFVTEMKRAAKTNESAKDLLLQLERSFVDRIGYWKHGGIVGVRGYGGGVIGRYSELGEEFPAVAEFHTFRVNMPSGWFYTTDHVDISIEKNILSIRGYAGEEIPEDYTLIHEEYSIGDYHREFTLSTEVDKDAINAVLKDGILTLSLPKTVETVKKIEIKTL